ncbi:3-phosphoshikimate 1-carboxyvinyltransferase [Nitrosophilus alvini]|uniref:3-phosphoshikimate 1-carboxyvinyltransferase n=1 Tax=Nitrosophilus alvini TaxID=2714855 RepID=UPI00190CF0E5|nr:3-phosphoshikimate 1-carboxyvinyltransferase [Nitrosophilus alvini]
MNYIEVKKSAPFNIEISDIAPDKSISHRCAMFSLLSDKPSVIRNYLRAEDTLNTLNIVSKLGATIEEKNDEIVITPDKIREPDDILDCGNSGTAMRLFCGLLSSCEGFFVLTGDKYLRRRPMKRVAEPLRSIGAKIDGRENGNLAPLAVRGGKLKAFSYESKISSAQVKSAMILAALHADGVCRYSEPELSRDHTERMLKGMGADIRSERSGNRGVHITVSPMENPLEPLNIRVPADPSSAFFFAVAAAIVPGSRVVLKDITLNPTRIEAYNVLKRMGAKVEFVEKENIYEPIGDIIVEYAPLKGVEVSENIAWLIDELPALSIAMAVARGTSRVSNAEELRVKESDRIKSVVENLEKCGIKTEEFEDGYMIEGGSFKEAVIDSYGDHRIAMSFLIAGLLSGMRVEDTECIATSFPNFIQILKKIAEVESGN